MSGLYSRMQHGFHRRRPDALAGQHSQTFPCSGIARGGFEGLKALPLRKENNIVATRCYILRLKCTKFDFSWGCAPDPAGKLTALPQTS